MKRSQIGPKSYSEALEKAQKSRNSLSRRRIASQPLCPPKQGGSSSLPRNASPTKLRKKAKAKKRTRLPSRKHLVKEVDQLVSLIVRARDGNRCVLCGSTERVQCGHIFGRRSHGARFDVELGGNTAAQCASCNIKHNSHQWIFFSWFIDKWGREAFDAMYVRWAAGRKYSRLELIELKAELATKLASVNGAKDLT